MLTGGAPPGWSGGWNKGGPPVACRCAWRPSRMPMVTPMGRARKPKLTSQRSMVASWRADCRRWIEARRSGFCGVGVASERGKRTTTGGTDGQRGRIGRIERADAEEEKREDAVRAVNRVQARETSESAPERSISRRGRASSSPSSLLCGCQRVLLVRDEVQRVQ